MSDPAIDERILEKLYELQDDADPDLVADLIRMFFALTPTRISRLRDALQSGDTRQLEREAHDLKSSAANLGATTLSSVASDLEKLGRKGSVDGGREALAKLALEFERAKSELTGRLS
jgi:HPt (histidine-containing phosphotransfer) domain-containing protein